MKEHGIDPMEVRRAMEAHNAQLQRDADAHLAQRREEGRDHRQNVLDAVHQKINTPNPRVQQALQRAREQLSQTITELQSIPEESNVKESE